jgi:PilZ domain-containing protein
MDRRREQRVSVDLPVQIAGKDANSRPFTQTASLRTISGRGATLQGVSAQLKPGDTVELHCQNAKAQFRVVWLGKPGTELQGEIGVENLSSDVLLWDPPPSAKAEEVRS